MGRDDPLPPPKKKLSHAHVAYLAKFGCSMTYSMTLNVNDGYVKDVVVLIV